MRFVSYIIALQRRLALLKEAEFKFHFSHLWLVWTYKLSHLLEVL